MEDNEKELVIYVFAPPEFKEVSELIKDKDIGNFIGINGYKCHEKNTDTCYSCKLRMRCYTHEKLPLTFQEIGVNDGGYTVKPLDDLIETALEKAKGRWQPPKEVVVTMTKVGGLNDKENTESN